MLNVITLEEALRLIGEQFRPAPRTELIPLSSALGRILSEDILAKEPVPGFDRSTVDGFAVSARDTFGCSESIPTILNLQGQIRMGEEACFPLGNNCCVSIPTGGALPEGADSVVMLEYTEDYGDGTVGILKSAAPGDNLIFRGDDVFPGKTVLKRNRTIRPQDIGALAALGVTKVPVLVPLKVGILSTGDELVEPECIPGPGQIRNVNSSLVAAQLSAFGMHTACYPIVPDEEELLRKAADKALSECDALILSGGSSVGLKDASSRVISSFGPLLFHGLAIKPGKPTILGRCDNKPIIGLPGHPVAAFFVTQVFVLPLMAHLMGRSMKTPQVKAVLTENVSANHGRALYCACRLFRSGDDLLAEPIRTKSGLITALASADGYFCIDRDCEGLMKGSPVRVYCLGGETDGI